MLFAGMVGTAAAADLPESPAPTEVARQMNWSGVYLGLKGSYDWAHSTATIVEPFPGAPGQTTDPSGAMIGGELGYNYQAPGTAFVFGLSADFQTGRLNDSGVWEGFVPVNMNVKDLGSVTARIGYATGRWLPYVMGGYAFGNAARTDTLFGLSESDTKWYNGWTAGVGAEYAINKHWSLKGEYRYTDLGSQTFDLAPIAETKAKLTAQSVDFGVNYRF
jgi:outer membrane immunogenic protein